MKYLKPINDSGFKYNHLIGIGGIGSGIFFKLFGNHTIGRNESREGELLPNKDYCKLHIITHYLASLLGTIENKFRIYPIGGIGNDPIGEYLFEEMKMLGMNMKSVKRFLDSSTLFSVCFQYPDFTGGNITSSNSASSKLNQIDITSFFNGFEEDKEKEIILSVPEVPIEPRLKILEIGRSRGSFNACSVSSFEIKEFNKKNSFINIDLLAINIDEAKTIASLHKMEKYRYLKKSYSEIKISKTVRNDSETIRNVDTLNNICKNNSASVANILNSCITFLVKRNPNMMIAITDGPNGSYGYYNNSLEFTPAIDVDVKATGGAGDAFMAGILAGLCCGLPFLKGKNEDVFYEIPLRCALELGSLLASLSVTSVDSINHEINAVFIKEFVKKSNSVLSHHFKSIFRD